MAKKVIDKFSFQKNGNTYELDITGKVNGYHLDDLSPLSGTGNIGKLYYNPSTKNIYRVNSSGVGVYFGVLQSKIIYEVDKYYYKWNGTNLVPIGEDSEVNSSFVNTFMNAFLTEDSGEPILDENGNPIMDI